MMGTCETPKKTWPRNTQNIYCVLSSNGNCLLGSFWLLVQLKVVCLSSFSYINCQGQALDSLTHSVRYFCVENNSLSFTFFCRFQPKRWVWVGAVKDWMEWLFESRTKHIQKAHSTMKNVLKATNFVLWSLSGWIRNTREIAFAGFRYFL